SSRVQSSPGAIGRFRTTPEPNAAEQSTSPNAPAFTFLLGSCNLSSIRVANLLALVAGFAGLVATKKALLRTDHAPFRPPAIWRRALSCIAALLLSFVYKRTAFRQPPPHQLVSPFLRLSALFATRDVTFVEGQARPRIGAFVVGEQSRALGAVLFDAIVEKGAWASDEQPG